MNKRVYWRIGDQEVEIEGDPAFIQKHLKTFFERVGSPAPPTATSPKDLPSRIVAAAKSSKVPSPAEYYRQKNPNGGTETLVVLAKYLEEYRNKSEFSRKDINAITSEAKLNNIHAQYYTYAVQQGLLRNVGRGTYGLSISGEDAVAAMPSTKKA